MAHIIIVKSKENSIKTTSPWHIEKFSYLLYEMARKLTPKAREKIAKQQIEPVDLKPGQSVLDVGCGLGDVTVNIKKRVGDKGYVVGIAPSLSFIKASRKTAGRLGLDIDFKIGKMENLEFASNSFDIVTCFAVMMNVKTRTKVAGLKEIFRVLKPRGRVIIYDLAKPLRTWRLPFNFWYYRMVYGVFGNIFWQGKFPEMMAQAGFANIKQTTPKSEGPMWLSYYSGTKPLLIGTCG